MPYGVNLFEAQLETAQQARARWAETLQTLNAQPVPSSTALKASLSEAEINHLHAWFKLNPILQNIDDYAPGGGCFLRAHLVNLLLRREGIHPDSLGKVIKLIGQNGISHHVANVARASDGEWWATDFSEAAPMKLADYGSPLAVVTEAAQWGPVGQEAEHVSPLHFYRWHNGEPDFSQPVFGRYLDDVKAYLRANPRRLLDTPLPEVTWPARPLGPVDLQTIEAMAAQRREARARAPFDSVG